MSALILVAVGSARSQTTTPQKKIVVGTKVAAPFALKNDDGTWTGISIELWRDVARELDLAYELKEFDLKGLLSAVETGKVDAGVAALTITPEREQRFDFSHPFHTTGLGIAVEAGKRRGLAAAVRRILSLEFFQAIGALSLLLFAVGILIWFFERKRNPAQFGGSAARGIGSGFWWSPVTMTTVGYGDKAPVTFWGRILGLVWMFAGIIMISGFTAAIASSLTLTRLESKVRGPEDLARVRVVSLRDTTSDAYLRRNNVRSRAVGTPQEGLRAVASGNADAFVYDAPILKYLVHLEFQGVLDVVAKTFERQDYGIAFPEGSPLREPVNRVMLEHIRQPEWQDLLHRYLGE
jgi:ABC-type amino acid transport substrate-binding protein